MHGGCNVQLMPQIFMSRYIKLKVDFILNYLLCSLGNQLV